MRRVFGLFIGVALLLSLPAPTHAQSDSSRFGLGLQLLGSTAGDNVGPGVHFRASTALNPDVSLALGSGLTGFIFRGRDDSAFALDPQLSAIVSFSTASTQSTYVIGGVGAYVPFGNLDSNVNGGPTLHFGVGKVWLLNESSFFLEVDPALFIGEEETNVILPLRAGGIF